MGGSIFLIIDVIFLVVIGFSVASFAFYLVAPPGKLYQLNQEAEFLEKNCDRLEHDDARFQCIESLIKIKQEILNLERDPIITSEIV